MSKNQTLPLDTVQEIVGYSCSEIINANSEEDQAALVAVGLSHLRLSHIDYSELFEKLSASEIIAVATLGLAVNFIIDKSIEMYDEEVKRDGR